MIHIRNVVCVLLCAQVVAGQSRVQVTLANNAKFDALVRGSDPEKDLAVLKISPTDEILTPVQVVAFFTEFQLFCFLAVTLIHTG